MRFYDSHIHFYFKFPAEELKQVFSQLMKGGLLGFSALIFTEFPNDINTVRKMVPGIYHNNISIAALEMQQDPFPYFEWAAPLTIIPFVDARFIEHDIEAKMERFKQRGFKGLKLLYVPEEDRNIQVQGMEQAFGRPVKRSEEIAARLIDSAASQGMCVLFHVDLRRYGNFVEEMLHSHPATNFNIPHFGSSRKALSHLLESYPNCYTDTSSLMPFMIEDPESYKSFIRQFQNRILYGSDALISNPGHIESTRGFLDRFLDDPALFHKLTGKNYREFHGLGVLPAVTS
jgi:hypothetical protein